jgi:hypothetical protein
MAAVTAVATGVLGVIAVLSDVYYFFLTCAVLTILGAVGVVLLLVFRYRTSRLAPESNIKVQRYGKRILSAGWILFFIPLSLTTVLLVFFNASIFDPVTTNANASAITMELHRKEFVFATQARARAKELSFPVVFLTRGKDAKTPASTPYELSFDVAKKDRFPWAKIESVTVKILSCEQLPTDLVFEQAQEAVFRPATEFKAIVHGNSAGRWPLTVSAYLVSSSKPVTRRGSILIEDRSPQTFYVDVCFEREGIYEIVPELTVTDGWRRRQVQPLKPVKVACAIREAGQEDHPFPIPAPPPPIGRPTTAPKPP